LAVSCVLLRKGFHRSSLLDRQIRPPLKELVKRRLEHLPDVMGRYDGDGNWSVRAFHRSSSTS
jgi:hypothetical protein